MTRQGHQEGQGHLRNTGWPRLRRSSRAVSWWASASHVGATMIGVTGRALSVKNNYRSAIPMSHAEAKLRLKRWYVAGSQETFDPQVARTSHIKFGGRGLHMLASDAPGWCSVSEEDLNEMARRIGDSAFGHGSE